jgi:hypothetical protein
VWRREAVGRRARGVGTSRADIQRCGLGCGDVEREGVEGGGQEELLTCLPALTLLLLRYTFTLDHLSYSTLINAAHWAKNSLLEASVNFTG